MKKRLLALLLAVVLCIGLLPVSASAVDASVTWVDGVDADGDLTEAALNRNGIAAENSGSTTWREQFYIVQANSNVTITGDLTVGMNTTIILCDNSTLKVTGSLNVAASGACIFGQTSTHQAEDAGKLIVQNTVDAGAAVRSTSGYGLSIYGGSMELHGGTSKQLTDNVGLYSKGSNGTIMKGTRDGEALTLDKWDGVQALMGSKLVLEYCEHDDEDTEYVHDEGANTHHLHCNACGLDYRSEACNFEYGDVVNAGAEGHRRSCWCGNQESTLTEHTFISVPTRDGQGHTSGCQYCDYTSGGTEQHVWDAATGKCTVCDFYPVATDDYNGIYGSVEDALEAGYPVIHLYSHKDGQTEIYESVTFNAPGKSVTLDTAGYTLVGTGTTLTVEDGTLILTNNKKGDNSIHIEQPGRNETAAPAIEVTGGKLIVDGDLTAEGGFAGSGVRKPAIKATGGELELNGKLSLKGGLTLKEPAKLTKPLTQGVFWAADGESQTYRVDLRGDKASEPANHPDLESILETGYIFVQSDENGTPIVTDGSYGFYSPDGVSIDGNTTIVAHTHSYHQLKSTDYGVEASHACDCGKSAEHTFESGVCSVCGYTCPHSGASLNTETGNYECSACGMTMVIKSEKDGATTYYSILGTALAGAEDGATVTLLADLTTWEVSRGGGIYGKEITLDLNGHSITTPNGYNIGVQDEYLPATLKIVGKGNITPALIVVPGGKLDLSGWTGGTITNVSMSDRPVVGDNRAEPALIVGTGAGHIQDLTYSNWLIGKISQTTLRGGSYGKIVWMNHEYSEQPAFPTSAMLASGYAFKNSDGSYVLYTKTLEWKEAFTNVSVVQCPHGALVKNENDGKYYCGYCNTDMSNMAAEITYKDGSTGYSSDPHADGFYRAEAVKVKLLKNFDDFGTVNHAMTIDLNGKTITGLRVEAAGVQIIDSAETKGSIGTLTVTADGVTLRDLLADGYGFKSGSTWVAEDATSAANVTIAEVPIKDVFFYDGSSYANRVTELTKTYGEERTLYAHWNPVDAAKTYTHKWEVRDSENGSWELLEDAGGTSCTVPAFAYAGTYTYRFTVTCDGYSKSADITVTVNKADIANTSVDLADNGEVMFLPNASTGAGEEVSMRVVNVLFKNKVQTEGTDYTVSGNTGVNVGDYTLTITAAPGSQKFAGTKTVSWKITPFKLGAPNFTGGPFEKNYDGTTTPPTGYFAGSFDSNGSSSITLTEGTHLTCTANLVDANVGNGKAINFSVTLKSPNYVFSSRLNAVENCTVSADGKTLTYSNYSNFGSSLNVKPIDLPVALPALSTDITNGAVQTYTMPLSLPALPAPMQYGTVTYGTPAFTAEPLSSGESYDITATVDENGVLSLEVRGTSGSKVGKIGTVTIPVTTTNFNRFELTVDVNAQPAPHTGYSDQVKKQSEEYEAKKRGELPETGTFTDVDENDYFFDAVEWAAENGITGGVSAERFGAALDCSRAQTMTFLWRAMGEPEPGSYDPALTDVKRGSYYYDAVLWAMQEGITTGAGKGLFAPDATVTRGQFVTFLYRLSGEKSDAVHPFTDVPAGSYYEPAIAWAYSKGITTGTSKTAFSPDAPCTRAQIITFLYRYFNQK